MSEYDFYLKSDFSRYAGKWVAILNNKVVSSGKSFKEVAEKIDKTPDSRKALIARIPEKMVQLL